mmetsp:Transcript_5455/g.10028  ORF Transcript_5455/g.10028 Transcript_5455/m.10028 type:complete len:207 (-) Transcript_5455:37-657(-)
MATKIPLILCCLLAINATLVLDLDTYTDNKTLSCLSTISTNIVLSAFIDYNLNPHFDLPEKPWFSSIDIWVYPCVSCAQPSSQAANLINALGNSTYGTIWLDVEVSGSSWSSNQSENQSFISTFLNTIQSNGKSAGVFSSYNDWQQLVGVNWSLAGSFALWYDAAEFSEPYSFDDYEMFGGWSQPTMKRYDILYECLTYVGQNYAD